MRKEEKNNYESIIKYAELNRTEWMEIFSRGYINTAAAVAASAKVQRRILSFFHFKYVKWKENLISLV